MNIVGIFKAFYKFAFEIYYSEQVVLPGAVKRASQVLKNILGCHTLLSVRWFADIRR